MQLALAIDARCVGCGACCMYVGRPPFTGYSRDRDGSPCTAFDPDTRQCTIYQDRPQACRDFTIGGGPCQRVRIKAGIH